MAVKVYIAGLMSSEADVAQRKQDRIRLENYLEELGVEEYEIYNPIEAPFNDKSNLPTAEEIYEGDKYELLTSDFLYASLDGEDAGVMAELGMAEVAGIPIISSLTDIRTGTAGEYDKERVPYGYNQFIIGLIKGSGGSVHLSSEEALKELAEKMSKYNSQ